MSAITRAETTVLENSQELSFEKGRFGDFVEYAFRKYRDNTEENVSFRRLVFDAIQCVDRNKNTPEIVPSLTQELKKLNDTIDQILSHGDRNEKGRIKLGLELFCHNFGKKSPAITKIQEDVYWGVEDQLTYA